MITIVQLRTFVRANFNIVHSTNRMYRIKFEISLNQTNERTDIIVENTHTHTRICSERLLANFIITAFIKCGIVALSTMCNRVIFIFYVIQNEH